MIRKCCWHSIIYLWWVRVIEPYVLRSVKDVGVIMGWTSASESRETSLTRVHDKQPLLAFMTSTSLSFFSSALCWDIQCQKRCHSIMNALAVWTYSSLSVSYMWTCFCAWSWSFVCSFLHVLYSRNTSNYITICCCYVLYFSIYHLCYIFVLGH